MNLTPHQAELLVSNPNKNLIEDLILFTTMNSIIWMETEVDNTGIAYQTLNGAITLRNNYINSTSPNTITLTGSLDYHGKILTILEEDTLGHGRSKLYMLLSTVVLQRNVTEQSERSLIRALYQKHSPNK